MAVALKRSTGILQQECEYGCCTELYSPKTVPPKRRQARRRTQREARKLMQEGIVLWRSEEEETEMWEPPDQLPR